MVCLPKSKAKPLTDERARELLDYNRETGALKWRTNRRGCVAGADAGTITNGYLQVQIDMVFHKAHRVIWLMETGRWPQHNIDHINRKRSDNRWCNLRDATPLENARNKGRTKRNKSGFVGVSWNRQRGKWDACIGVEYRTLNLGCFEAFDDACEARCEAEKHYFGEFARDVKRFTEGSR